MAKATETKVQALAVVPTPLPESGGIEWGVWERLNLSRSFGEDGPVVGLGPDPVDDFDIIFSWRIESEPIAAALRGFFNIQGAPKGFWAPMLDFSYFNTVRSSCQFIYPYITNGADDNPSEYRMPLAATETGKEYGDPLEALLAICHQAKSAGLIQGKVLLQSASSIGMWLDLKNNAMGINLWVNADFAVGAYGLAEEPPRGIARAAELTEIVKTHLQALHDRLTT